MKINIQKFARVVIPFVSVFVILGMAVVTASAAGIDYNDYVTDVVVDGDNDLVTVTIPGSMCYVEMYDFNNSKTIYSGSGASHEIELSTPVSYLFRMHVLGYPWGSNGCLDISNIPAGTVVRTSFSSDIPYDPYNGNGTPGFFYTIYRDAAFNNVSHASVDYSYTTGLNEFDFTLSKPSGAIYLELENSVNLAVLEEGAYTFQVNDTVLVMSISSLYRLQQETGKTNTILAEVQKQLESNGQKLEDIISGSSDQQDQAGQFKDEIGSVSGALVGAGSAISGVPKPTIVVDDLVPSDILNGSAYLSYVTTIQEFWKSETLSSVTVILGGLILVSYILFGEKG